MKKEKEKEKPNIINSMPHSYVVLLSLAKVDKD